MSLLDNAFDAPVSSVLMVLLIFMYCKLRNRVPYSFIFEIFS